MYFEGFGDGVECGIGGVFSFLWEGREEKKKTRFLTTRKSSQPEDTIIYNKAHDRTRATRTAATAVGTGLCFVDSACFMQQRGWPEDLLSRQAKRQWRAAAGPSSILGHVAGYHCYHQRMDGLIKLQIKVYYSFCLFHEINMMLSCRYVIKNY